MNKVCRLLCRITPRTLTDKSIIAGCESAETYGFSSVWRGGRAES